MDLTTRSQQAVSAAVRTAAEKGNPAVEPAHLAAALLSDEQGLARPMVQAVGVDPAALGREIASLVDALPSAAGSTVSAPQTSRNLLNVLAAAERIAKDATDEYVSGEHLLLALAEVPSEVASTLTRLGANPTALRAALTQVRGSTRVEPRTWVRAARSAVGFAPSRVSVLATSEGTSARASSRCSPETYSSVASLAIRSAAARTLSRLREVCGADTVEPAADGSASTRDAISRPRAAGSTPTACTIGRARPCSSLSRAAARWAGSTAGLPFSEAVRTAADTACWLRVVRSIAVYLL